MSTFRLTVSVTGLAPTFLIGGDANVAKVAAWQDAAEAALTAAVAASADFGPLESLAGATDVGSLVAVDDITGESPTITIVTTLKMSGMANRMTALGNASLQTWIGAEVAPRLSAAVDTAALLDEEGTAVVTSVVYGDE